MSIDPFLEEFAPIEVWNDPDTVLAALADAGWSDFPIPEHHDPVLQRLIAGRP